MDECATPCSLELTVKERVKEWTSRSGQGQWPPNITGSAAIVAEVAECSNSPKDLAAEALDRACGDKSEAVGLLLDEEKREELARHLALSSTLPAAYHSLATPKLKQAACRLRELYPDAPGDAVVDVVAAHPTDVSGAASELDYRLSLRQGNDGGDGSAGACGAGGAGGAGGTRGSSLGKGKRKKGGEAAKRAGAAAAERAEAAAGGAEGGGHASTPAAKAAAASSFSPPRGSSAAVSATAPQDVWRQREAPVARHNFLMKLTHFVEDKVRTVNRRCLICDGPLSFVGLKPTICDKDICAFQYQKLGLGVPLATTILNDPEMMDLLISFLYAAVHGGRISLFYPKSCQATEDRDGSTVVRTFLRQPSEVDAGAHRKFRKVSGAAGAGYGSNDGGGAAAAAAPAVIPAGGRWSALDMFSAGTEVDVLQCGVWVSAMVVDARFGGLEPAYKLRYAGFKLTSANTTAAATTATNTQAWRGGLKLGSSSSSSGGGRGSAAASSSVSSDAATDGLSWVPVRDIKGIRRALPKQDLDDNASAGVELAAEQMDLGALKKTLSLVPSVEEMSLWAQQEGGNAHLRQELDRRDVLIYPLLRWLVTTNRAHLRRLRDDEMFSSLGSKHQFVLMSGAVEREQEFQRLKRVNQQGSLFLWHGSSSGNWHVILRTSLKNMSGTKHMSAGAAYGNGIYFATDAATSLGYSNRGVQNWPKSIFGPNLSCLALCEVVNDQPNFAYFPGKGGRVSTLGKGGIYVVPQEEYVTTRFFIVNPSARSIGGADSQALVKDAIQQGRMTFLADDEDEDI